MKLACLSVAVLMLAGSAAAQDTSAPPPKPEKKICRRIIPTGSIMARSVCHTKAEWADIAAREKQGAEGFKQRPMGTPPSQQ